MNVSEKNFCLVSEQAKKLVILNSLSTTDLTDAFDYIKNQLVKLDYVLPPERGFYQPSDMASTQSQEPSLYFSNFIVTSVMGFYTFPASKEKERIIKDIVIKLANRQKSKKRRMNRNVKLKSFEITPNAEAKLKSLKKQTGMSYSVIIEELLMDRVDSLNLHKSNLKEMDHLIKSLKKEIDSLKSENKQLSQELSKTIVDNSKLKSTLQKHQDQPSNAQDIRAQSLQPSRSNSDIASLIIEERKYPVTPEKEKASHIDEK